MHKNTFAKTIHKQHYVSNFFNNLNSIEKILIYMIEKIEILKRWKSRIRNFRKKKNRWNKAIAQKKCRLIFAEVYF